MTTSDLPSAGEVAPAERQHPAHESGGSAPVLRALQLGQHGLFVLLLVLGAARAMTLPGNRVSVVAGTLGVALWYGAGAVFARRHRGRLAGGLWLAVLIGGWVGLVVLSPEFSWVAFPLFFLTLHLLPSPNAMLLVAGMTAVVVAAQWATTTGNRPAQVLGPCLGAAVAVGMSLVYRRLAAENHERRLLVAELLAAQGDLVATHDELAAAQREAGALGERARLARDIHDTLAQGFSSVLLLSRAGLAHTNGAERAGATAAAAALGELRTLLAQIESTAADNLEEARRVVHALAPAALDQAPLPAALQRLVARLVAQSGLRGSVHSDGEVEVLPTAVEVALLRLAQGALANVRQHARASRVGVTLTYAADEVRLDVVDDGVGFDPAGRGQAPLDGAGFGLRAMHERLSDLGGALVIESSPGAGTAVSATVPRHGATADDGVPVEAATAGGEP